MEIAEILATIEELRASQFQDLDDDLLKAIVAAEAENIDDRSQARTLVEQSVEDWLDKAEGP